MSDHGIHLRLKEERERLGVSQEVFGGWGGVSFKTQNKYERQPDARPPDANYLKGLDENDVDIVYIVTGRRAPQAKTESADSRKERSAVDTLRMVADSISAAGLTERLSEQQIKDLIGYAYGQQCDEDQVTELLKLIGRWK